MAHKCDQCGDAFASTAALVQHFSSCSGRSKSGEGERSATASASSGRVGKDLERSAALEPSNEGFQCHLCPQVLGRRDALKVHLTRTHRWSDADANRELDKHSRDPRAKCQHCGKEMNKKQLAIHYRICKKLNGGKKVPRGVQDASGSQDLNVSRDSLVKRAGNLEINKIPLVSDEKFLEDLREYLVAEEGGNLAVKTAKNYMYRIDSYGEYWKKENPNFSFGKLCIFGSKECLDPPSPANWEIKLGSAQARGQGLSAFNKMIDFLRTKALLAKDKGLISKEDYGTHESGLRGIRDAASRILKKVEKYKEQEKTARDGENERLAEGDKDREVPGTELEKIIKAYLACDYRKGMFNFISGDLEDALRRNKVTPTQVRDFVFVESIVTAPGGRNDAWYQMKVKELLNPTYLDDGKKVCIEVGRHKTLKNYGAARDIMPVRTYNVIVKFYQLARPLIYPNTNKNGNGEEYVFVQGGNGNWFDRPYSVLEGLLKKGSDFEYHITPYAIRKYLSTEAQGDSSALVRENMPRHMNHSVETAKKSYRKKRAVMEEHSKILDKLVPWATTDEDQLPDVELNEEDVEADRARVRQQENEKRTRKREEQEQRVQDSKSTRKPGGRYFFSSEDRKIIKTAFLGALDKDGNLRPNITLYSGIMSGKKSDFQRAYETDRIFREMVDRIMRDEGFTLKDLKKKIKETYRNLCKENLGNMSASTSGAGKGKAPRPKISKGASSKAKRKRMVVESESEESDESNDSEDYSDEESE